MVPIGRLTQEPPVALRFVSFIQVVCNDASPAGGCLVSTLLFIESTVIVTQRDEPRPGPLVTNMRMRRANGRSDDLVYLTEVDHHDHEAIVALDAETGSGVGCRPLRAVGR